MGPWSVSWAEVMLRPSHEMPRLFAAKRIVKARAMMPTVVSINSIGLEGLQVDLAQVGLEQPPGLIRPPILHEILLWLILRFVRPEG